ncbi:RNA-binding S4 domain-containing protein [Pseudanabaena mucicola]|uniref:RNA-binding S4 domain-containing protein n=1 Tax=Pseudanabaena mucicola FACHB-723 TaxID=2692860 RepID=A0ABR8A168_9CYAN|nr:RNA-binding S4 domain-containing protein [Pseudanabaena mucicola]MBD2189286.1 RNA-binding S4 domain-containing protein [Pseudanabaena mucicola FACHB-723]
MQEETVEATFELTGEYITLSNLLKVCGVADTGGVAKLMIIDGEVEVDGQIELRKGCKIRAGQIVSGYGFAIAVVANSED